MICIVFVLFVCGWVDPLKSKELNWEKRMRIIHGTTRGLQYLHKDSRLKIIHRDLKRVIFFWIVKWNLRSRILGPLGFWMQTERRQHRQNSWHNVSHSSILHNQQQTII